MRALCHNKNFFIYATVLTAQIGSLLDGCFMAWTSPIIVKLSKLDDNPLGRTLTETEEGYLSCIGVIGISLGCYSSGYLSTKFGRRKTLLLMSIPAIIGCLMLLSPQHVWWILLARTIWGVTIGAELTIVPMYIAEIADSTNRGKLGSLKAIFMNIGILISMSAGPFVTFFLYHSILAAIPILHFILMLLIIPESPYYLVDRNSNEAQKVLQRLRGSDDVKEELSSIQRYNQERIDGNLSDILHDKVLKKGLILGCGLIFFQQCSGVSIIMSYGQKIFEEVDDFLPSAWSALIIAAAEALFGFVAPTLIDRSGRKILLIISDSGIVIALFIFGLFFYLKNTVASVENLNWLPLMALVMYKFMYSLGAASVPWILVGEIFPQEMKGIAAATVAAVSAWTTFVLCLTFNPMNHLIGIYGIFWIFSGIGILALVFAIVFVFETKGKSLQEIQEIMK